MFLNVNASLFLGSFLIIPYVVPVSQYALTSQVCASDTIIFGSQPKSTEVTPLLSKPLGINIKACF